MKGYVLTLVIFIIVGCNKTNQENLSIIKYYHEKEIVLPSNIECSRLAGYKLVTYIDFTCGDCISMLPKWNDWRVIYGEKVTLLCIYSKPMNNSEQELNLSFFGGENVLVCDTSNVYLNENKLQDKKKIFQTFLLDKDNKVILIGNPLYNGDLEELYRREIENIK